MKNNTAKFFQYEDGRTTQVAFLDGYSFGDRLLEGVCFKCTVAKGGMTVEFVEPNNTYVKGLNKKKWLKEAKDFAVQHDIFDEAADGSGEQIELIAG